MGSLGDRMKAYEKVSQSKLMRRTPVVLRLDGKAFHTFTRDMEKPFDPLLSEARKNTLEYLCENIQGCILGYSQSDELSLVIKDWHNFQNFAKWFEDNDIEGYHIDKDIKVEGNRVYGPDTCTFVTPQKNKEFSSSKHYKMLDPEGNLVEFFNMSKFCRDNDLSVHNLCNVVAGRRKHHKGYTRYEEENNNDM